MKTELQQKLISYAPGISIDTSWSVSEDVDETIFEEGCALSGENREDWTCWDSEVKALTVARGDVITGSAHMGGTWERAGEDPARSNPDMSGYELDMADEALRDLESKLSAEEIWLREQIKHARKFLSATQKTPHMEA